MTDKDKYINQLNNIKVGNSITIYTAQNVTLPILLITRVNNDYYTCFFRSLLHISRVDNVHLGVGDKRAYALAAVGQQNNVPNNSRIEKIPEDIIRDTSVHSSENKAVGIIKGFYRRYRRFENCAFWKRDTKR